MSPNGFTEPLMRETWIHPNRRAILFACIPPALLAGVGASVLLGSATGTAPLWRALAGIALLTGLAIVAALMWQLRRPRVAYDNGSVLFYLRRGAPIACRWKSSKPSSPVR